MFFTSDDLIKLTPKQLASFAKSKREEITNLAMEHRNEINKRELNQDVSVFVDTILYIGKKIKRSKKMRENLRITFRYDHLGYTEVEAYFDILESDREAIRKNRRKCVEKMGEQSTSWVWRKEEALYEESWKRVKKFAGELLQGDKPNTIGTISFGMSGNTASFDVSMYQCSEALRKM